MAKSYHQKSEFEERVLDLRRVTRVVAGGKRFSFRASLVIGNLKGKVGIGVAKGLDPAQAIEKARHQAQKNLINVELKDNRTIPFEIEAKYGASRVKIKPARKNHGLVAGGATRIVLQLAGVKDVSAKILGSTTNKLTNALATIKALKQIQNQK